MKIKVKGLVFVGFAAAVFASSAMADPAISGQNAKNTVTSKYYVEHNFQKIGSRVASAPANDSEDWNSTTKYPSMAVLKSVKDTADDINVVADSAGLVNVTEGTGDNVGTFTVGLANAPATTAAGITGTTAMGDSTTLVTAAAVKNALDTAITATSSETDATVPTSLAVQTYVNGYVNGYAQDKSKIDAATETEGANNTTVYTTTISSSSANDEYPTSRNVYQYVESRITGVAGNYQPSLTTSQTGLYVGHNTGSATTWQQLEAAQTTGNQASTDYVTIKYNSTDSVYDINLNAANVTSSSSDIATNTDKLATSGAVYDFVSGGYQAKDSTTTPKVGYNGGWSALTGTTPYVTVTYNNGNTEVAVTNTTTTGNYATQFVSSTDTNSSNRNKLATSGDVYDFVTAQLGGAKIPAIPSACTTAAGSGAWCALVYGKTGGTNDNPTYGLIWTIMAPDDGVTAENEPFGA